MTTHLPSATNHSQDTITALLHPRSVAIVGASNDPAKWGGRLLHYMLKHRMDGPLYPINPRADTLMGVPCYPSLVACPGPVDMAILLVPGARAQAAIEDCAAAGVKLAIAITAGFSETGEEGAQRERTLVQTAKRAGVRLIGPNCMGLLNTHHTLAATTAVSMGVIDHLPVGGIGMASQSGALMGAMLARGLDVGAGFSALVSLGNQADVDQNDIFEYLIADPHTEVITLYVEAAKAPERFVTLLRSAHEAGKPVLIVKSGRTTVGERAVKSHTASLAGAWPSFEAVCRAHGAYLFDNVFDLLTAAMLLQQGQRMRRPGVAVFSGSGGGGALMVDALAEAGLALAELSPNSRQALGTVLPPSHCDLPVDFGVIDHTAAPHPRHGSPLGTAIGCVMEDDGVGAGLVFLTTQPNMESIAQAAMDVGRRCGKPLLFVHGASAVGEGARQELRRAGYGYVESPNDAVSVLRALWRRETMPCNTPVPREGGQTSASAFKHAAGFVTEPDARRLIEGAGIPTTQWRFAETAEQAASAARDIGGAVAVKAVSPTLVHKSDLGVVKLRCEGDAAVLLACASIAQTMAAAGHALQGFLVTEMVNADAELIAGIQHDPDFGPMVMVGAGGVLVELLHDVQLCPAPLCAQQAQAMLNALRCRPLLGGWRGRPPVDAQQLVDVLVALGHLAVALPALKELDINPLMVANGRVVAADARALMA